MSVGGRRGFKCISSSIQHHYNTNHYFSPLSALTCTIVVWLQFSLVHMIEYKYINDESNANKINRQIDHAQSRI